MCLTGLLTTGCEKATKSEVAPAALPYSPASTSSSFAALRIFNGVDNCARSGGNCLDDIIVVPDANRLVKNMDFDAITGHPKAVKEYFNGAKWQTDFPSLALESNAPFLERLRSGECDIKRMEAGNKVFYYAGAGKITPFNNEVVIPIIYK